MSTAGDPESVLQFCFSHRDGWWKGTSEFDAEIRDRFGGLREEVLAGHHEDWRRTARGALAYVIVLNQFSRNMFRRDKRAYEADAQARQAAREAVDGGHEASLAPEERTFLYMPFEHSEELADQERSVALFRALGVEEYLDFAERHLAIVKRFGHLPHRNEVVGRTSTAEEVKFLKQPSSSFG